MIVTAAVALGGMALNAYGANQSAKASQKALEAQARADEAGRAATANSMIASVNSQNGKVTTLKRNLEIVQMQSKADGLMRKESYNEMAATAMVMGAASGRIMGEGSIDSIFDKSKSDFMWDEMWSKTGLEITEAAVAQDIKTVYESGATSLLLGGEQLSVARLGSMAGQSNTAAAAQTAFNNTLIRGGTSLLNNYGTSLLNNMKG